ncbi:MAG TPA: hypothetical protein DD417_06405 [Elusimicrobia bacterium]|nr:hypothetical protein [Elusimicrobiota bacterium]
MGKHPKSVDTLLLNRIQTNGPGWVFSPADFSDLGSRTAVATALKRHKAAGAIRQLGRGLYDVPRTHAKMGQLWPELEAITGAVKRRDSVRLQPTGAYAANLLGLSDQVPMRVFFLTDGPKRKIKVGKLEITFKRTTPRNMATCDRISGLVIQALRWLGKREVDKITLQRLRRTLDDKAKRQILDDLRYAPVWIAEALRRVAAPDSAE